MINMEHPGFLQHSIKCYEPSVQWSLFVLSQSAQHSRAGTALSPSPQLPLSSFQRLKYCVEGRAGLRSLVRASFSLEEGPSAVVLVMSWESRATPTNACTNSQNWAKLNLVLLDQRSLVLNDSAQMSVCVCACVRARACVFCGIRRVCVCKLESDADSLQCSRHLFVLAVLASGVSVLWVMCYRATAPCS